MGNAETLLSTNFFNAKIMLVSSVAVSMFSKVPILNSLNVLLVNDGFGNSWICNGKEYRSSVSVSDSPGRTEAE
jgi:hypothetical protein